MTTQDERAIRSVLAGVIDSWNRHDVGGEARCDSGGVSAASRRPQAAPCREEGRAACGPLVFRADRTAARGCLPNLSTRIRHSPYLVNNYLARPHSGFA